MKVFKYTILVLLFSIVIFGKYWKQKRYDDCKIELMMNNDSISILNDENKQSWSIIQDLVHEKNLLKKESDHLNERLNNWRKWYRGHEKGVRPENISYLINIIETDK